jgi:hypothetical protein
MEKQMEAMKMMVHDPDEESAVHLRKLHFLQDLLPLLESLRTTPGKDYHEWIDSFQNAISTERLPKFSNLLEIILLYLKAAYHMEFYLEETLGTIAIESISCPLVHLQAQRDVSEWERKTLCYHCYEFHFNKYYRMFEIPSSLQLYPDSCQQILEKTTDDKPVNPLFY